MLKQPEIVRQLSGNIKNFWCENKGTFCTSDEMMI